MADSDNHSLIGKALLSLRRGLLPFVEREMRAAGREASDRSQPSRFSLKAASDDVAGLLFVITSNWNGVFGQKLGRIEQALVFELREHRNSWAHQKVLDEDDTYRVLDSTERLLRAIGADDEANTVKEIRLESRQAKAPITG
jgi:hypothetical protein